MFPAVFCCFPHCFLPCASPFFAHLSFVRSLFDRTLARPAAPSPRASHPHGQLFSCLFSVFFCLSSVFLLSFSERSATGECLNASKSSPTRPSAQVTDLTFCSLSSARFLLHFPLVFVFIFAGKWPTAMDWHYAMMNDVPRNEAYKISLVRHVCALFVLWLT